MTRRFCRPLFSILIDLDRADLAGAPDMRPPQGCEIDAGDVDGRTRPWPTGGFTDMVRTSSGRAASSASLIQRVHRRMIGNDERVELLASAALSSASPGTSKSSRPLPSAICPPVTAPAITAESRWRQVCMRISR